MQIDLNWLPVGNIFGIEQWLIILVIVLLLFGGKKIPELLRGVGRGVGELQKGLDEGKQNLNKALHEEATPVVDLTHGTPLETKEVKIAEKTPGA